MEKLAYLDQGSKSKRLYDRALSVMPGGNSRHTIVMDPYPAYAPVSYTHLTLPTKA